METSIWIFIAVGFLAQMIDGALGMAYGVSSNAFLLSIGIPPAAASASVHAAEVVTTAVSGISHWRFGNIDKKLLLRLMLPGVIGAAIGAYILSSLPGDMLRPYINAYLLVMGLVILRKAFITQPKPIHDIPRLVSPLGFIGGFFDAIGGGGWGPIVTTTLVARGNSPRTTIGSVNASEFFVTLSQSIVFILTIGLSHWNIILGLLIGGVIAAPFAAFMTRHLPTRLLMFMVGALISFLSVRSLVLLFNGS
jgi:uncharacterized protein